MNTTIDQVRLAEGYLDVGNPLLAVGLLEAVRPQLDGDRAAELLLARGYFHSAQLSRARDVLEPLVEQEPTDVWTRFLLARTLERQSETGRALSHLRLVTAMSDRPEYRERLDALEARIAA
ncbi:tetratricopeptide repeat protein [Pseudonocardia endophytica]|uniref:Tetratricopeptide repeat protein n=1 Tax=Pseudonocardia endophytica TaxID=401976 RepID=A0A4R1HUC7_PSEEN|nr:tetratricopeptide repeat protein [Pseudonocardia endophytica]TCK24545.1 tetratricopeptide repeat protein [Pseudonocardia endophytica]